MRTGGYFPSPFLQSRGLGIKGLQAPFRPHRRTAKTVSYVTVRPLYSFYKEGDKKNRYEVDFLVRDGKKIDPIEVKSSGYTKILLWITL